MREQLYWAIQRPSLRYAYFLFFDTIPYLADQLFIRRGVRVWFDQEYVREGSSFIAISCHVRKKDVPQFLNVLEDLKSSMMLCGHPDYVNEVSSLMDSMEQKKGAVGQNELHADGKAKQE